jgi:hypothetical protein
MGHCHVGNAKLFNFQIEDHFPGELERPKPLCKQVWHGYLVGSIDWFLFGKIDTVKPHDLKMGKSMVSGEDFPSYHQSIGGFRMMTPMDSQKKIRWFEFSTTIHVGPVFDGF